MSETGSAPPPGEGSGSSGSGGGQTSDPGKTGAVQEIARNEASFAKLPADVIGLICDQLDQKSRLAILSVNKAFSNNSTIRQKVEADAQDHVMLSFKEVGGWEATGKALPGFLTARYRNEYVPSAANKETTDFTYFVEDYLGKAGGEPRDVINFASALHISAQAACRLDANYKAIFEGMIHKSLHHVNKLLDPSIVRSTEYNKLNIVKGQLETMGQKLRDIRNRGDAGRAQQPPKR